MKEHSERQTEILSAAFTLIANHGVQELTMKNLGAAIGVSEPALYRHFASKRDILAGIVDRLEAIRNETWELAKTSITAPLAALQLFFSHQARQFEEFPPLAILLFPEEIFRNDPELLARIHSIMQETTQDIEGLINKAKAARCVRPEIDSCTATLLMTGGFRMLVAGWRGEQNKEHPSSLVQKASEFLNNTIQIMA
ncbi:MAG: TetR/AcrR family transcriptional regulator [Spirochaetia bacterium]|nr:TetR/AcrR family transcriptional regulator [Spirochaetia bacterium]